MSNGQVVFLLVVGVAVVAIVSYRAGYQDGSKQSEVLINGFARIAAAIQQPAPVQPEKTHQFKGGIEKGYRL